MKVPYARNYGGRKDTTPCVVSLSSELGVVPNSSFVEKFGLKFEIKKRVGINTTKFVKTRTRFNSDGFASVALVDAV